MNPSGSKISDSVDKPINYPKESTTNASISEFENNADSARSSESSRIEEEQNKNTRPQFQSIRVVSNDKFERFVYTSDLNALGSRWAIWFERFKLFLSASITNEP